MGSAVRGMHYIALVVLVVHTSIIHTITYIASHPSSSISSSREVVSRGECFIFYIYIYYYIYYFLSLYIIIINIIINKFQNLTTYLYYYYCMYFLSLV